MPTLVLPPRYTPDTDSMRQAALRAGWAVARLSSWRVPDGLAERAPVLYGEPLFAGVVAAPLGLALLQAPFDWLATLAEAYRRRSVTFTTLRSARFHLDRAFFKPADDKCFPAAIYESGALLPDGDTLPDDTPVLIAEPVRWEVEYRCFVYKRTVLTLSSYLRDGDLTQADDGSWPAPEAERTAALDFAETLLADPRVPVPPALVLDVGIIQDRGWAVVEANTAWGAGIYGCDPDKVILALARASVRRDSVSPEDAPWVRALAIVEE